MKGLKETAVRRIRTAFEKGHEIFRSLEGWPTCTVFKPTLLDGARGGDGAVAGVDIYARNQDVEWDMKQESKVGVAAAEAQAFDITFEFHYNFLIPDDGAGWIIAIGEWIEEETDFVVDGETVTRDGYFGPKCPICDGEGTSSSEYWNNPLGEEDQCSHCMGVGLDIYDDRIKFYRILRTRHDERMEEVAYDAYGILGVQRALLTTLEMVTVPQIDDANTPDLPDEFDLYDPFEEVPPDTYPASASVTVDGAYPGPSRADWLAHWLANPEMENPMFYRTESTGDPGYSTPLDWPPRDEETGEAIDTGYQGTAPYDPFADYPKNEDGVPIGPDGVPLVDDIPDATLMPSANWSIYSDAPGGSTVWGQWDDDAWYPGEEEET